MEAMTKAFDTQALVEKLNEAGLPILEKDVKLLTGVVFDWTKESVKIAGATQPLYLIAVTVVEQVEALVLSLEDKIDGVTGN